MHALVEQLLARCTFPAAGQPLHCAVSGGADSSALLVLASAAGCQVTAHHVDHGLRPRSGDEAAMVAALADRFDVNFRAHRAQVEDGPNLEARARTARYALLPDQIATGHTLDDRAETMLINLMRGAGRKGLAPLRGGERHPIIGLRRSDTVALCDALDIAVVADPTNNDPRFQRNRVRHELLPLLDDIAARDVAAVLDRQAAVLADEDDFLDTLATQLDATDAKALTAAPTVLARRALRQFIMSAWPYDHPPGVESIERALEVARGSIKSCEIEGGHRIHRTRQQLRLEPPLASVTQQ